MTAKEYRQKAWNKLSGKWGTFAIIALIYEIIVGALSGISYHTYGIADLALMVIAGPFTFGMVTAALNVSRGSTLRVDNLFEGFKSFTPALLLHLLNTVLVFLWSLLLIVPGIIKSISYSMSFFILHDNPEMDVNEARLQSMAMMEGHKWEYFCLMFSFIGWLLLSILTLGILTFWITPYIKVASAEFYEHLKNGENVVVEDKTSEEVVVEDKAE